MKVSASIVSYNSEDEIQNVLDSLNLCREFGLDSVWVIDNCSSDKTVSIIKDNYSWVHLYESDKNLGYGGGHNIAIKAVDSDIHLIVNPDITLSVEEFKNIISFIGSNEDVSLVCPKVMNSDGTEQFLPKRNPKFKYLLGSFGLFKKYRDEYTMKNDIVEKPVEVEFCTGCFMICRTKCLKECGGFDDRYFLYFEDADLTRLLKKYGKVLYNPQLTVTHAWKRENKKSLKGIKRFLSSYIKYRKKWRKNNG